MSTHSKEITQLDTLFDEPRPLDQLVQEVLSTLVITQQELAEAAGLTQTAISKIARRKTTSPSAATLKKLRHALVEVYGISPDRATFDYLAACRALLEPRPAHTVDSRLAEFDQWLHTQPDAVQENFWTMLDAFQRSVDSARSP